MKTYDSWTDELHHRMDVRRKTKKRNKMIGFVAASGSVCLAIVVLIAIGVSRIPNHDPIVSPGGAAASILADNPVIGYLIVGLLSLCFGVALAVFCMRMKMHIDEENDNV